MKCASHKSSQSETLLDVHTVSSLPGEEPELPNETVRRGRDPQTQAQVISASCVDTINKVSATAGANQHDLNAMQM